jgi:hypothetical protein
MAIIATSNGSAQRELIEPGNYVARCYKMIQIGTVKETINGTDKMLHKVRIGWELPTELRVFKEENGEQPVVIDKEYTLSMSEKSNLRQMLKSWRGKDFTEEEAKAFDITVLLGKPCLINIIHKPSKTDPARHYEEISGITTIVKGMTVPPAIHLEEVLSFDNFNHELFESLPDFIKDKIKSSEEYKEMMSNAKEIPDAAGGDDDDTPF